MSAWIPAGTGLMTGRTPEVGREHIVRVVRKRQHHGASAFSFGYSNPAHINSKGLMMLLVSIYSLVAKSYFLILGTPRQFFIHLPQMHLILLFTP
jgi:hypothetical protein